MDFKHQWKTPIKHYPKIGTTGCMDIQVQRYWNNYIWFEDRILQSQEIQTQLMSDRITVMPLWEGGKYRRFSLLSPTVQTSQDKNCD